jgi:hypothetical protein
MAMLPACRGDVSKLDGEGGKAERRKGGKAEDEDEVGIETDGNETERRKGRGENDEDEDVQPR